MKLINGKMNIPYIVLKSGYATGAEKLRPKRVRKAQPVKLFNPIILRMAA